MTLTVGRERHINAIIRTRFKVLESSRFAALGSAVKREFLRRLLINTLRDRPADQEAVIKSPRVSELSPVDRARLLRWLAAEWLLFDSHTERVQELLRDAQSLAPGDAKTAGLALLMRTAPGLARRVLWIWRQLRPSLQRVRLGLDAELRKVRPPMASSWR